MSGVTILDAIAARTRRRVRADAARVGYAEMEARARRIAAAERARDGAFRYPFEAALSGEGLAFICEVKKASPSKGVIAPEFPYLDIARDYERAGASAISCLTEPVWFLGRDAYAAEIAREVGVPVLRKDFTVDAYMVCQAKVLGAAAVLLICSILSDEELASLGALARDLGMSALVEAHDAEEVRRAVASGARIVGVNNRNLKDFSVDFGNAEKLRALIPDGVLYVAESGVRTAEDVRRVAATGADAVLVGEALMRAEDRPATLAAFRRAAAEGRADAGARVRRTDAVESARRADAVPGVAAAPSATAASAAAAAHPSARAVASVPLVKFCGLSQPDDVAAVNAAGPDYVGFVFWPGSRRCVSAAEARALRTALDPAIATVGVFVDAPVEEMAALFEDGVIDVAQLHGSEDAGVVRALRARCPDLPTWQAVLVRGAEDVARANASEADAVVLDAGRGAGEAFDWALLAGVQRPYVLAGGLDATSVAQALSHARPLVVDVSSGIEADSPAADGRTRKDPARMLAFAARARCAAGDGGAASA